MTNISQLEDKVGVELVNLLKCNICWEFFTEPTVLPCGHTFCYACLNEIGRHTIKNAKAYRTQPDLNVSIFCPNCRHSIPFNDVVKKNNGVRFNFALSAITDQVRETKFVAKVDASTNTDTQALEDTKLEEIEHSLDSVFISLKLRQSITNEARDAIDEIRRSVGHDDVQIQETKYSTTQVPCVQFTTPRAASSSGCAWAKWKKKQEKRELPQHSKRTQAKENNIVYRAVPLKSKNVNVRQETTGSGHYDQVYTDPAIVSHGGLLGYGIRH